MMRGGVSASVLGEVVFLVANHSRLESRWNQGEPGPAIGCETSFESNNVNSVDEAPYKESRTFKVLEYDDEHDIHASES